MFWEYRHLSPTALFGNEKRLAQHISLAKQFSKCRPSISTAIIHIHTVLWFADLQEDKSDHTSNTGKCGSSESAGGATLGCAGGSRSLRCCGLS